MAVRELPVLLLDVDGVLCPVEDNGRPGCYRGPSQDFRAEHYRHHQTGETIRIFVSEENARRVERLRAVFDVVWATGWVQHANRVIAPLHRLPALPFVQLEWSEGLRSMPGSWKLPAVAAYAGDDRPCVWIDDDLRPDVQRWADGRRGPTLLIPIDHRVGLTDDAVERALRFARAVSEDGGDAPEPA
jgi:hypothetical protein